MERRGYVPAIQGGGGGEGFQTPNAPLFDEPRVFNKLVKKIVNQAVQAESRIKNEKSHKRMNHWNSML